MQTACTFFPDKSPLNESLFEDLVIGRLPRPRTTTAQDLADAFATNVLLISEDSFEERYKRFILVAAADSLSERCSSPFVCFTYVCSERFDLRELQNPVLWKSDDFVLSLNGTLLEYRPFNLDLELHDTQPHVVYATLVGHCTARALDVAVSEISSVLPSLFRSFEVLARMQFDADLMDYRPEMFEGPWGGLSFMPRLTALLDAYFSSPSKKEPGARRIRNAVHLISSADDQSKNAVGLALSVSAMESLLCENRGDVGKMLGENVANLLEPDPKQRFNAIEYVKKLYDSRSKILHGSEIEASQQDRDNARTLAAAVLIGFMDRWDYIRRLAPCEEEKPHELFKKLEKHRYDEGPFLGVIASPVISLWRSKGDTE